MVFSGSTSGNAASDFLETASKIVSYSLVNNSAGSLTITAGVLYGSTLVLIYSGVISANSSYQYTGSEITIQKDRRLYVSTSGAGLQYYFTIE